MKESLWLVAYLKKNEEGNPIGRKTAVRADTVIEASTKVLDWLSGGKLCKGEQLAPDFAFITDIGLADDCCAELIGHEACNPLSSEEDWPF